jgi:hypothetical protein
MTKIITGTRASKRAAAKKLTHKKSVKKTVRIIYGQKSDPEVKKEIALCHATGQAYEVQSRESFDTGKGHCGKQCSCKSKEVCKLAMLPGAFPGDTGSTMGMAY